jgi:hypothetical protein
MNKVLAAVCLMMLLAGGAFAANTVTLGDGYILLSAVDGDFVWSTARFTAGSTALVKDAFPEGLHLTAIKFRPGAASDKVVVRNKSLTGSQITSLISIDGGPQKDYIVTGKMYKPYIEYDDVTLSSGALVWLEFDNQPR